MAEMKSMKLSRKQVKDELGGPRPIEDAPKFPYGLRISLDEDSLANLGMSEMPKVGEKRTLMARVDVIGVSESERQGREPDRRLELQITHMALAKKESSNSERAKKIFGKKDKEA